MNKQTHIQKDGNGSEEYLTKQELATRLRKCQRTVENWQRRGIVPAVKLGHAVLYNWEDVKAHLQEHFRICNHTASK